MHRASILEIKMSEKAAIEKKKPGSYQLQVILYEAKMYTDFKTNTEAHTRTHTNIYVLWIIKWGDIRSLTSSSQTQNVTEPAL